MAGLLLWFVADKAPAQTQFPDTSVLLTVEAKTLRQAIDDGDFGGGDNTHQFGAGPPTTELCSNIGADRYTDTVGDDEYYCAATDTWQQYAKGEGGTSPAAGSYYATWTSEGASTVTATGATYVPIDFGTTNEIDLDSAWAVDAEAFCYSGSESFRADVTMTMTIGRTTGGAAADTLEFRIAVAAGAPPGAGDVVEPVYNNVITRNDAQIITIADTFFVIPGACASLMVLNQSTTRDYTISGSMIRVTPVIEEVGGAAGGGPEPLVANTEGDPSETLDIDTTFQAFEFFFTEEIDSAGVWTEDTDSFCYTGAETGLIEVRYTFSLSRAIGGVGEFLIFQPAAKLGSPPGEVDAFGPSFHHFYENNTVPNTVTVVGSTTLAPTLCIGLLVRNDSALRTWNLEGANVTIASLEGGGGGGGGGGSGDMTKVVYDTNDDGSVDLADGLRRAGVGATGSYIDFAPLNGLRYSDQLNGIGFPLQIGGPSLLNKSMVVDMDGFGNADLIVQGGALGSDVLVGACLHVGSDTDSDPRICADGVGAALRLFWDKNSDGIKDPGERFMDGNSKVVDLTSNSWAASGATQTNVGTNFTRNVWLFNQSTDTAITLAWHVPGEYSDADQGGLLDPPLIIIRWATVVTTGTACMCFSHASIETLVETIDPVADSTQCAAVEALGTPGIMNQTAMFGNVIPAGDFVAGQTALFKVFRDVDGGGCGGPSDDDMANDVIVHSIAFGYNVK